jgi:hypothetical protein
VTGECECASGRKLLSCELHHARGRFEHEAPSRTITEKNVHDPRRLGRMPVNEEQSVVEPGAGN